MIFWLMLATLLLITHVKKQRNQMCQKWDKCLQSTTSPNSKSQKLLPFLLWTDPAIVILKLDLLWFEGIYLIFGTFDFLVSWRG